MPDYGIDGLIANPDGLEAQSDFEEGVAEVGVPMTRRRPTYRDRNGNWVPEKSFNTHALFVPTQPTQPYSIIEYAVDNAGDGNPINIYLPVSDGKPLRTDLMQLEDDIFKISTVNLVPYGNVNVCWQCELVRVGKDLDGDR